MTITTKTLSLYLHSLFCWKNYYFYLSCGTLGIYISMTPNDFLTSWLLGGHPFLQTGWLRHHEDQSYELYLISGSHRDHPLKISWTLWKHTCRFYLHLLGRRNTFPTLISSFILYATTRCRVQGMPDLPLILCVDIMPFQDKHNFHFHETQTTFTLAQMEDIYPPSTFSIYILAK